VRVLLVHGASRRTGGNAAASARLRSHTAIIIIDSVITYVATAVHPGDGDEPTESPDR
jgi:hypothetical protein